MNSERYLNILKVITTYYGISDKDFTSLLKDKNIKYLLVLFLSRYKCMNEDNAKYILNIKNKRSLTYTVKKAEEKFFVNRDFRMLYFEIEKKLDLSQDLLN